MNGHETYRGPFEMSALKRFLRWDDTAAAGHVKMPSAYRPQSPAAE